jgi:hypothetical protein
MDTLWIASIVIISIVGIIALLLLGDYLGHKFGRRRLATTSGFIVLGVVVLFAIFAIVHSLVK